MKTDQLVEFDDGSVPFKAHYCNQVPSALADGKVVELIRYDSVGELLSLGEIRIPDYQRGYCWERKQIEGLLESIAEFPWSGDEENRLHLGTVVLHRHGTFLDVVDGQQRLITLSILFHSFREEDDTKVSKYQLLNSITDSKNVQEHVYWAKKIIDQWKAAHDLVDKLSEDTLTRISVHAVIINGESNLGLAYTFFNAINSAGKKLTDYDLLKPHHLRYPMGKDQKEYLASEWDQFVQEKVITFRGEALLADELVDCTLYRLRNWARGRPISDERHHVFEHFQALRVFSDKAFAPSGNFTYRDGLGGGAPFFTYINHFAANYRQFVRTKAVSTLYHGVDPYKNRVLWNTVRAVLFQYFCRFGYANLEDALLFITERLGRIRANNAQLVEKRIFQKSGIFCHTVNALDEASSPEYFFAYCVMPTNLYALDGDKDENRRHVKPAFWDGAREMFKLLSDDLTYDGELKWCGKDSEGNKFKERN